MYSNHGNRELHKTIEGHASVWNHPDSSGRRYYAIYGKYIGKFRLINHISKLKRLPRFVHWNQQRSDFHWKLAHQLTDEYDEIRLEDLNLKGMQSLWGRKVNDLALADFVSKLVYIASKKGVKITFMDRWYPSSRTCSVCGAVNEALNLRDRTWQCPNCHTQLDIDRNAAINIYRVGTSTRAGEDVSPGSPGNPCG